MIRTSGKIQVSQTFITIIATLLFILNSNFKITVLILEFEFRINSNKLFSGKSGSLKSLHYLLEHNPHIEKAIVFSQAKYGSEGKIQFVPIFWAGEF